MMFPRAPELAIMKIGFVFVNWASIASLTSSVACVQISMSSWRRSSSVMMPLRYCCSTFWARFSCSSRIFCFSGGVVTSSTPIVTPALVA